jgi:catechol 2,3-dioxygenase-like lactoylglutathione lyase family enzyme
MSEAGTARTSPVTFEGCSPIFRVQDIAASVDYYVRALGFKLEWQDPVGFACVSRGRLHLFLSEGDQGHPGTWIWVGVDDAEALHQEYGASGAKIRHPPTNYAWACEMQVEDLDGNVLRLGSEPLENQPVGEWLDMYGNTWRKTPEGGWTKV